MQVGTRILVSIATYNERGNILRLMEEIHQYIPEAHILVVDDNSPDGTGTAVDELAAKDSRVHCLHREGKLGLGTAILAAMRYAMAENYDFMINMDADFSHPPRYLPDLIAAMADHDLVVGSRYIPGGGTENWTPTRKFMSVNVNRLVRLLFRMGVRDASGGFRCYRVSKLREVDFDRMMSRGYSFQQEVMFRCHLVGCRMGETPIIFENRKFGQSKVNLKETVRSLSTLVYLGLRYNLGLERRRKKSS
jgi:dolichol-phosphate mannosyltransferase